MQQAKLALLPEDMQACIKETEDALRRLFCTFHFNDMPLNDWEDRLRDRLYDCVNNCRGTLTEVLVQEGNVPIDVELGKEALPTLSR